MVTPTNRTFYTMIACEKTSLPIMSSISITLFDGSHYTKSSGKISPEAASDQQSQVMRLWILEVCSSFLVEIRSHVDFMFLHLNQQEFCLPTLSFISCPCGTILILKKRGDQQISNRAGPSTMLRRLLIAFKVQINS